MYGAGLSSDGSEFVYAFGGTNKKNMKKGTKESHRYDLAKNVWSKIQDTLEARAMSCVTQISDDEFLIAGNTTNYSSKWMQSTDL